MRISKKSQYALRAVFELALRDYSQPVKIHEIAHAQNIPARFLELILNQLRQGGFVDSRRGKDGGYMIARAIKELTVGEVIRYIQGEIFLNTGNERKTNRRVSFYSDHAFEKLWKSVNTAISEVCDNTTFSDLIEYEKARKTSIVPNYTI